jgi:hypothetical protein
MDYIELLAFLLAASIVALYYLTRRPTANLKATNIDKSRHRWGATPSPLTHSPINLPRPNSMPILYKPAKHIPPKLTKPGFGGFDTMPPGYFSKTWSSKYPG